MKHIIKKAADLEAGDQIIYHSDGSLLEVRDVYQFPLGVRVSFWRMTPVDPCERDYTREQRFKVLA